MPRRYVSILSFTMQNCFKSAMCACMIAYSAVCNTSHRKCSLIAHKVVYKMTTLITNVQSQNLEVQNTEFRIHRQQNNCDSFSAALVIKKFIKTLPSNQRIIM